MAVVGSYDWIDRYIVRAKLREPLHVGSVEKGNGEVLVHPVKELPFVQASGIAGVFRACYEGLFGDGEHSLDLFGDNEKKAGRIRFTDGIFSDNGQQMKIELRPRIKIDPVTGTSASAKGKGLDSDSGQKFEMEYIGAGQEFSFNVYVYSSVRSNHATGNEAEAGGNTEEQNRIKQVFALIHSGQVQFGGQKSNGCGSMKILSLRHRGYDMRKEEDRRAWTREDEDQGGQELKDKLDTLVREGQYSVYAYQLTLDAQTEGSILVKSIALEEEEGRKFTEKDEKEPDYVSMRNSEGYYIVPGSSVKGAVRAQFERILGYLEKNVSGFCGSCVVADAFGREARKNYTGAAGNVRFQDILVTPIKGQEKELVYNRIHIDRFTGGVMNTGLFKEQAVHGKLQIKTIVMKDNRHQDHVSLRDAASVSEKRSCAMLILSLRDLALGIYNLGSGYSVGRGFLKAKSLTVHRSDNKEAVVHFHLSSDGGQRIEMEVEDPDGIIADCMKALTVESGGGLVEEAGEEGA